MSARPDKRLTRIRRLAQLPDVCSARVTAWACMLSWPDVQRLILSGILPARRVCEGDGQKHFEIAREDVLALAAGLE